MMLSKTIHTIYQGDGFQALFLQLENLLLYERRITCKPWFPRKSYCKGC